MKTVGYLRVSTDLQDVDNQRLEVLRLANDRGLGSVEFVEEIVSGRKSWRDRELAGVLAGLGKGDVVIVAELSRLGRSMLEIMEILSIATRAGVVVYAVKGEWVLDGSLQSKVVALAFSMASEIERDLIASRTRAALATKAALLKDNGYFISKAGNKVYSLGRPPGPGASKLDEHREGIIEDLAIGVTRKRVAARLHTTEGNLRNWLRKRGL